MIPDMYYRDDIIGERWFEEHDKLHTWGYLREVLLNPVPASKNCPDTERAVENCGSPTLRFGEVLNFYLALWPRKEMARPATLQISLEDDAKASFFKLGSNVFG